MLYYVHMNKSNTSAIQRAVDLADGGVPQLASACGVSVQAVYKWLKKGYPPTDRCQAIESAVGGKVSRFDLLPPTFTAAPKPARPARKPPSVQNLKQ